VHGVTDDGAVLVRPDGFVAWRSEGPSASPETALREALTAILDRS
jgi:putative polyketide hydroxylase